MVLWGGGDWMGGHLRCGVVGFVFWSFEGS